MAKNPFFSIVIPSLNEELYLPHLLADLQKQSYQDFEVIHVDGSSEDKTVEATQPYKDTLDLYTEITDVRNVSHQRNLGASKSRGQWVVFMDADNRLPAYFLDGIRYQIAKNDDCDLFTTWITTDDEEQKYKAIVKTINIAFELYASFGKPVSFGALIGVKREILDKVRFDETQKVVEDCYFIQDARDAGYNFHSFKEPQYNYSLRRIKKEGNLKMAYTTAKIQLRFLLGQTFDKDNYGYEMQGGGYYQDDQPSVFRNLHNFITEASQKQLRLARKKIKKLL